MNPNPKAINKIKKNILSHINKINNKTLTIVASIIFIILLIINTLLNVSLLGLSVDILGVESNVIYSIQTIRENNSALYNDPSKIPYSITQYTPLYYVFNDIVNHFFNIPIDDHYNIRLVGRIISLSVLLVSLYLLFHLLNNLLKTGRFQAILVSVSYFIFTTPWLITVRPDIIVIFCYISGIITFYHYLEKEKLIYLILFSLISTVAIFSKQNGIMLAAIPLFYFIIEKKYNVLIKMIIFYIIFSAGFIAVLTYSNYIDENIWDNIMKGIDNGLNLRWAVSMTFLPFLIHFGLLVLTVILFIIIYYKRNVFNEKLFKFILLFCITQLIFSTVTALKRGSAINYYFELLLLISIVISIMLVNNSDNRNNYRILFNSLFLIAAISITSKNLNNYIKKENSGIYTNETSDYRYKNIKLLLTNNLMEGDYFFAPIREINIMFPLKCIIPQYDIFNCCTYPRKTFNYERLCEDFSSGKVKILITYEELTDYYDCKLTKNYLFYDKMDGFFVYLFKENHRNL